ncbi:MAG: DUF1588 domain-containing protein [Planctomycetia bacterium]|nr:DUF1588 domain-containing protein [Planctomycetia bacterium]
MWRVARTIRERLALHSQDASCAGCHHKIDPFGYGLERFDPIGRPRSRYPKDQGGKEIDASGELPSGEAYADFESFRRLLHGCYQGRLTRTLVEELSVVRFVKDVCAGTRHDRFCGWWRCSGIQLHTTPHVAGSG